MALATWMRGLFDRSFDPARARRRPQLNANSQSNVPGLYLVGEIAGTPLIKLGLNAGVELIDHVASELTRASKGLLPHLASETPRGPKPGAPLRGETVPNSHQRSKSPRPWPGSTPDAAMLDILIVGAGSSGLGAADRCEQLGLDYVVIEQQRAAQLIRDFTKGKHLFAEPQGVANQSRLWFEECSKEELLARWDRQIPELGLKIHEYEQVTDIRRRTEADPFEVVTDRGTYAARRVVLAIGMAGNPRRLNVPGEAEHADKISQNVADPQAWQDADLLVFGAGDVACEAAVALADRGNRVTMVAPDREFTFPRKRNVDAVNERARTGRLALRLSHRATVIRDGEVDIIHTATGEKATIPYDHIFRCIGADLPFKFLDRIGVRLEGTWDARRWVTLACLFVLCYTIYAIKKPAWPMGPGDPLSSVSGAISSETPPVMGQGVRLDPVFWYAMAYSLIMTHFGLKAYRRWAVQHRDDHQKKRYICLLAVQWTLGFIVPAVLMYWVHHKVGDNLWLGRAGNYWHAFGLELAFPLFFSMFFYDVGLFYLIYGLVATFLILPIFSIFHGKRYCSWICGCGGLAETLGDRWRHLAPKGSVSIRWEWMNLAVLVWAFGAAAFVVARVGFGMYAGSQRFDPDGWSAAMIHSYGWVGDFWLSAVIPVTLYPIFGGKIWCRYWCPLARWMQFWSRAFGRLRIVSNDRCIACGECSRYCQVGIDVMSFAKNRQELSNVHSSCIQCGICITVCPMDVLRFERRGRQERTVGD